MEDALIAAVHKRAPLWDSDNEYHKHVGILKKCWDEVAFETGQEAKKAKTKWKNLRDYYRYELRRKEKKHPESESISSTWQWFDSMAFLKEILNKSRESKDLSITVKQEDTLWGSYSTFDEENFVGNLDGISDVISEASLHSPILNSNIPYSDPNLNYAHTSPESPRKRLRVESTISEERDPDDDLLFLRSLLSYIKPLPIVSRLRLRSRIQDCVLKEVEMLEGHFDTDTKSKPK